MNVHRTLLALVLVGMAPIVAVACGGSDDGDEGESSSGGGDSGNGSSSGKSSSGSTASSSGASGSSSGASGSSSGASGSSSGASGSSSGASGSSSGASGSSSGTLDDAGSDASDASTCAALPEVCDGVSDDNCNGSVDEGCNRCPLLQLSCPTGCCAVDRWQVRDQSSDYGSSIAVDPAGNLFFAYTRPNAGVWATSMAIYDALPGTWRTVELGAGTYRNKVLVDSVGTVHVMSGTYSGNYALVYRRSTDHGVTFSDPLLVGNMAIGGTFDMALDSTDRPHVAYDSTQGGSSFPRLTYGKLEGNAWVKEPLDLGTTSPDEPDLEIGFADRPTIVVTAYRPDGEDKTTKRAIFHNGNRWVYENFDTRQTGSAYASGYFTGHSLRLLADGSSEVLFQRTDAGTPHLYLSRRGPGDAGTWTTALLEGVSSFAEPTLFTDAEGRRAAVSNGVSLHRELSPGTWTTTPVGVPGNKVAAARRGRFLYLGYSDPENDDRPTVTYVDLGAP